MTTEDGAAAPDGASVADAARDYLAGTIWAQVDEALSGITATPVTDEAERSVIDLIVRVPPREVVAALRALRNPEGMNFDYLRSLTAVDLEEEGVDVVYHLYSVETKHNVTIKSRLPVDRLVVDSATAVWRAANWYEREVGEMFGVRFDGHPDPRNLLLPEEMTDFFPLRKSHPLAEIEVLQGEGIAYEEGEL
ncbi:MAG: NADH-quinone oxidoreductase subunit C [Chloroflexi bacterium]|nr:NADH-quinone oxidoreductase subunit C [Chloroflexota bacterium]